MSWSIPTQCTWNNRANAHTHTHRAVFGTWMHCAAKHTMIASTESERQASCTKIKHLPLCIAVDYSRALQHCTEELEHVWDKDVGHFLAVSVPVCTVLLRAPFHISGYAMDQDDGEEQHVEIWDA